MKKVLIVKTSALGDVIHALPVLSYLKSTDPDLIIDWIVEEPFAPLLEDHPFIRRVYRINTKLWRKRGSLLRGFDNFVDTVHHLRREKYDVLLDLQGNIKSGIFTIFSRTPLRYGFDSKNVREWPNLLATNRCVSLTEADHHITDRSLRIASSAFPGASKSLTAPFLSADEELLVQVKSRLEKEGFVSKNSTKKLILLHPGTTWKTKQWPTDLWKNLAAALVGRQDINLILSWGDKEEKSVAGEIQDSVSGQAMIWPRGTLKELLVLLSEVDLVVGGDTGPVHMAAALGTPTVSLFRATDAKRNGPRGRDHICLQSPFSCSPCLRKDCARDDACGQSVEMKTVLQAVRSLLDR